MKRLALLASWLGVSYAQYVVEIASFGHGKGISPHKNALPGWHISGDGFTPQMLSDRVILTPPHPGNKRGSLWTDGRTAQSEWTVDFEFRASGPEHGGGNLQIWYTKEGRAQIGSSSIYTVEKFEGIALVIDMHGGRGGGIRGFLNDGTTDFRNHHHVESLAFGHCDYTYRNLGRPSRIQLKQDGTGFEVNVDNNRCFRSDKVLLPSNNYFGITAASSETPDSFEVFKFVTKTSTSYTREEPRRSPPIPIQNSPRDSQQQQQQQQQQQAPPDQQFQDVSASSITSQDAQFADLHNRIQTMSHSIDRVFRELSEMSSQSQKRDDGLRQLVATADQTRTMENRLQMLENLLIDIRKEVVAKDYTPHLNEIKSGLSTRHDALLEHLPERMGHVISSRAPNFAFYVVVIVIFQVLVMGGYIVVKRRMRGAHQKYL